MFKERLLLPFVAVAGALLVAGCGGSSGGGGSQTAEVVDEAPPPNTTGYQAFLNLSAGLLATSAAEGETSGLDKLRRNLYDDGGDDIVDGDNPATADETEDDFNLDHGGGVTSSLTTHEEPAERHCRNNGHRGERHLRDRDDRDPAAADEDASAIIRDRGCERWSERSGPNR